MFTRWFSFIDINRPTLSDSSCKATCPKLSSKPCVPCFIWHPDKSPGLAASIQTCLNLAQQVGGWSEVCVPFTKMFDDNGWFTQRDLSGVGTCTPHWDTSPCVFELTLTCWLNLRHLGYKCLMVKQLKLDPKDQEVLYSLTFFSFLNLTI